MDPQKLVSRLAPPRAASEEEETYQICESAGAFYVVLGSWSRTPLGYGRCGAVVRAVAFSKRGSVLYGEVAIKYPHGLDSDGSLLVNERMVLARLNAEGGHPAVVKLVDAIRSVLVDRDTERPAIAIEYVDGWTLAEVVHRWPSQLWVLMDVIVLRWLVELGEGLVFMHGRGVAHQDLKMHNLMIARADLKLKIIDFGLSSLTRLPVPAPSGGGAGAGATPGDEGWTSWKADMAQVGRIVAFLVAKRSAAALSELENDSSLAACGSLLRKHASRFWGVKVELHRLVEGTMDAAEFTAAMRACKARVLEKQRERAADAKSRNVDALASLRRELRGGSRPHLQSLDRQRPGPGAAPSSL